MVCGDEFMKNRKILEKVPPKNIHVSKAPPHASKEGITHVHFIMLLGELYWNGNMVIYIKVSDESRTTS